MGWSTIRSSLTATGPMGRLTFIVACALFMGHWALSYAFMPYAYADEAMYLLNATALSGYPSNFANPYGIGYSLLLAPLIKLGIAEPYRLAVVLNAALVAGIFLAVERLVRDEGGGQPIAIGVLASLYPALSLYSKHALPEVLIALLLILMYMEIGRYARTMRQRSLVLLMSYGAFMALLHPRMAAVPIAGLAACALMARGSRRVIPVTLVGLAVAGPIIAVGLYAKNLVNGSAPGNVMQSLYSGMGARILERWKTSFSEAILDLVGAAAGQFLYVGMATLGLGMMALWFGVKMNYRAWRKQSATSDAIPAGRYQSFYLVLAFAGVLAVSAFQKIEVALVDQVIFGRYLDVFSPLLLAVALLHLLGSRERPSAKGFLGLLLAVAVSFLLIYLRHDEISSLLATKGSGRFWTIPGLAYQYLLLGRIDIPIFFLILVAIIAIGYLLLAANIRKSTFLAILLGFYCLQSVAILVLAQAGRIARLKPEAEAIGALLARPDFKGSPCFNVDVSLGAGWPVWMLSVLAYEYRVNLVQLGRPSAPLCGDLVFSPQQNIERHIPGACVLATAATVPPLTLYSRGDICRQGF